MAGCGVEDDDDNRGGSLGARLATRVQRLVSERSNSDISRLIISYTVLRRASASPGVFP